MTRDQPPPEGFTSAFLEWFRNDTQTGWLQNREKVLKLIDPSKVLTPWQDPVSWSGGLSNEDITELERGWAVRFPPDFRLFLQHLHAPARPAGVTWNIARDLSRYQNPFFNVLGFYDWRLDTKELREAFSWPLEGLLFDVEHGSLWLRAWGEKPADLEARKAHLEGLVAPAPQLIPVFGHAYLLAEPWQEGNPVLSIYQSDMIVLGTDLRDCFLREFCGALRAVRELPKISDTSMDRIRAIPFWGEFFKPKSRV